MRRGGVIAAVVVALAAGEARAAVTVNDAAASSNKRNGDGVLTVTHTPAAGSNRVCVGLVAIGYATLLPNLDSITLGGNAGIYWGSIVHDGTTDNKIWAYYWLDGSVGNDMVVTTSGGSATYDTTAGVLCFAGVDQASPVSTFWSGTASSSATVFFNCTMPANGLCYGGMGHTNIVIRTISSVCGTCTNMWDQGQNRTRGAGCTRSDTGAVQWNMSGIGQYAAGGGALNPAGSGAGGPPVGSLSTLGAGR